MPMTVVAERKLLLKAGAITIIRAQNKSGYEVTAGDVVVLNTSDSSATNITFTTSNTSDDVDVMGMAIQTIAKDEYGEIQTEGPTALLRVDGTANIAKGDELAVIDSGAFPDYTTGNCDIASGGTALTGGGSAPTWTTAMVGAKVRFASETTMYLIAAYVGTTALTISPAYRGAVDLTNASYVITYKGRARKATAGKGGAFATALEAYNPNDSIGVIDAVLFSAPRIDAGSVSLDGSYDVGAVITVDNTGGDVEFDLNDASNDNNVQIKNITTGTIDTGLLVDTETANAGCIFTDAIKFTTSGAASTIVDALDASDAGITNAINIGGNAIAGTNFNVSTAGAIVGVGVNYGSGTFVGTGNVAISTSKFTVNGTSGDTLVAGTLSVTGASTLTGNVTFAGLLKVGGADNHAGTTGTNVVSIFNGTAPVGSLTNGGSIYCAAGELTAIDSSGNLAILVP